MAWPTDKDGPCHNAVFNTLAYADIFNYPLTKTELNKWLINYCLEKGQTLKGSFEEADIFAWLKIQAKRSDLIGKTNSFYHLLGRSNIVSLRQCRSHFSQLKLTKAKKIAKFLSFIPAIKLIALTGALAMNNSDENDDIDLMIVTKTNRLWLTRLLVILILEFLHLRRRPPKKGQSFIGDKRSILEAQLRGRTLTENTNKICLNLFLDESALTIPKSRRNLYTAHEVCQLKPLINKNQTYKKFLSLNSWVKNFLPNALTGNGSELPREGQSLTVAQGDTLTKINRLAFRLQYAYMKTKITNEKISLHSAFFHPRLTGKIVLKKYNDRIRTVLNRRQLKVRSCRTARPDLNG